MSKQDNKKNLIIAADKLLQNNSLFAITAKDITNTANLSVGVFYNYFKSKEEIFKEVVTNFFDYSLASLKKLKDEMTGNNVRSEIKFKEAIINGIDKKWENNFLNGDIIILSRQDLAFKKSITTYNQKIIDLIADIIMITQPNTKERPIVTATLVMNLIGNSNPSFFSFTSEAQKEEYLDEFVTLIYNICFGKEK